MTRVTPHLSLCLRHATLVAPLLLAACASTPAPAPLEAQPPRSAAAAPLSSASVAASSSRDVAQSRQPAGTDALARAIRDYDARALRVIYERERRRARRGDKVSLLRAGSAALHWCEILKLRATLAHESRRQADFAKAQTLRVRICTEALALLDQRLASSPDQARLLFLKGELHAYRIHDLPSGVSDGAKGRQALARALELTPGDPEARLAWAKQFFYLPPFFGGDLAKAERLITALVQRYPTFEPGWGFLGQVQLKLGKRAGVKSLARARGLNPRSLRGLAFAPERGLK